MSNLDDRIEERLAELRRDPSHWSGYDAETRALLKAQAAPPKVVRKTFDPSIAGCPSTMG